MPDPLISVQPTTAISTGMVKTHNRVVNIMAALQVAPSIPF